MYDLVPIEIAASGMAANRVRMGVVASNLANANSAQSADGTGPYQRRVVRFQADALPSFEGMLDLANSPSARGQIMAEPERSVLLAEEQLRGVKVVDIERDASVRIVHDPTHPDADANGNVTYPDITVISEMTDMITASRGYEANLAVVKNTRDMLMQLLDLLKQ